MANKWLHKHGVVISVYLSYSTAVTTINAPDDNVVGNVYYLDPNHPNASDVAANRGCANVPYKTLATLDAEVPAWSWVICGRYNYSFAGSKLNFISDELYGAVFSGTGYGNCWNRSVLRLTGSGGGATSRTKYCIWDSTASTQWVEKSVFLKEKAVTIGAVDGYNVLLNFTNIATGAKFPFSLFYNCVKNETTAASNLYDRVFWNGTINYNAATSNLTAICAQITAGTLTENQAIAQVETDLGLAANTLKNNGFRLLNPHFINPTKGNYNIDYLNYDCSAILAIRDTRDWLINRGIRCEFPTDFAGGAGFGEVANGNDGFGGELYSRNISNTGVITNTAYDTVLVSKKFKLSKLTRLNNISYFQKILGSALELNATANDGTDAPNYFTFHIIAVQSGCLEDYYNSDNFTFSYTAGVLTCDFPLFFQNRILKNNRVSNIGEVSNGSYSLNEGITVYNTLDVLEFRIIAIKKGV